MKNSRFVSIFVCLLAIIFSANVVFSDQIIFNANFDYDTPDFPPSLSPYGDPEGDYMTTSNINYINVIESDSIFSSNSMEVTPTSSSGTVYFYGYPDPALGHTPHQVFMSTLGMHVCRH